MKPKILTLTTDFGIQGTYVASMKGVVLGLAPGTQFIDVTHSIMPQNIVEGAFVLGVIQQAFPEETVHLAVVDPGVGTDRRILAARVADQWFVAPDNGLLSCVLRSQENPEVYQVANPKIRRARVSTTFHGRDIMAPAAAHLLNGCDPAELGPKVEKPIALSCFAVRKGDAEGEIIGEVIYRDTFGNLITSINAEMLPEWLETPGAWSVEIAGSRIEGLSRTYADAPIGALIAIVGSEGLLEIASVNGDASQSLRAGPGATVWVRRRRAEA